MQTNERRGLYRIKPLVMADVEFQLKLNDGWFREGTRKFTDLSLRNYNQVITGATASGKTTYAAFLLWWYLANLKEDIKQNVKIICISVTKNNLFRNLWKEVGKLYYRSKWLQSLFDYQKEAIYGKMTDSANWFVDTAVVGAGDNIGEVLRGIHGTFPLIIADELEGILKAAVEIMENIHTADDAILARILGMGNKSRKDTGLKYCCDSGLWDEIGIHGDPDLAGCSERINKDWNRRYKLEKGEDDPIVRCNIRNLFPLQDMYALFNERDIDEAMSDKRLEWLNRVGEYRRYETVIGVDVGAGVGRDDTVSIPRQQLRMHPYIKRNDVEPYDYAHILKQQKSDYRSEREYVDIGGGWGHGLERAMKHEGYNVIPIQFGGKPVNRKKYANKRAEMYFEFNEMLKGGLYMPFCQDSKDEMLEVKYSEKSEKQFQVMRKDLMPKSPNITDARVLTTCGKDKLMGESMFDKDVSHEEMWDVNDKSYSFVG